MRPSPKSKFSFNEVAVLYVAEGAALWREGFAQASALGHRPQGGPIARFGVYVGVGVVPGGGRRGVGACRIMHHDIPAMHHATRARQAYNENSLNL